MLKLKVAPPAQRPGLIVRRRLLSRIEGSAAPVIALVAPAGYGKTTVLSQSFERTDRPAAWLNLDSGHGDPKVLMSDLAYALARGGLLPEGRWEPAVESSAVLTRGVDHVLESVDANAKGVLFIDQVDELGTQSALDVIGALMAKARDRLGVVMASRSHAGLPFGLLRARGDLLEFSVEDLALDMADTEELFRAVGVDGADGMDSIVRMTEGWPAATYLIALAIKAGGTAPRLPEIRGNDIYLADYLSEELLEDVSRDTELFLLRSSILPRMSGEVCDYVLDTEDSAEMLQELEESNLLVMPLDRTRTWYRYHSILRDYLGSELHRQFPESQRELNRRASAWFAENGFDELAIEHARSAGDHDRVALLLTESARSFYATGRHETLSGWLDWVEGREVLQGFPELAAVGALMRALGGDPGGAERIALSAYVSSDGVPREDADLGPLALMVRAYLAPRGADRALDDAQTAHEVLRHDPEWAHVAVSALALAVVATDGFDAAEPLWAEAVWLSESTTAPPLVAVSRAMRAITAIRRRDWESADTHLGKTVEEIEDSGLGSYVTSALAFIVAARIATHKGDLAAGAAHLASAAAIRPRLTHALPVYSVLALHQNAHAYIELADIAGARRVTRDADDILVLRPRLGTLLTEHEEIKERLSLMPAGTVGPSSLTGAELRLLPLLVTHLTYPEIGDRLYVSKHTVKTQAMSIYRKLEVSSRSEAVEKAREIGLIST